MGVNRRGAERDACSLAPWERETRFSARVRAANAPYKL